LVSVFGLICRECKSGVGLATVTEFQEKRRMCRWKKNLKEVDTFAEKKADRPNKEGFQRRISFCENQKGELMK
jgi:hypothetical protein